MERTYSYLLKSMVLRERVLKFTNLFNKKPLCNLNINLITILNQSIQKRIIDLIIHFSVITSSKKKKKNNNGSIFFIIKGLAAEIEK